MIPNLSRTRVSWLGAAVAAAGLTIAAPWAGAQGTSPFTGLTGNWVGAGSIVETDGNKESIRCKGAYSVSPSGERLHVELNCASDSYKVQIISNVVAAGDGTLSGTWREVTRQAEGDVAGRVEPGGQVQANLGGTGFNVQLSIATRGNRQAVAIRSQGTDVQSVTLEMHKA